MLTRLPGFPLLRAFTRALHKDSRLGRLDVAPGFAVTDGRIGQVLRGRISCALATILLVVKTSHSTCLARSRCSQSVARGDVKGQLTGNTAARRQRSLQRKSALNLAEYEECVCLAEARRLDGKAKYLDPAAARDKKNQGSSEKYA